MDNINSNSNTNSNMNANINTADDDDNAPARESLDVDDLLTNTATATAPNNTHHRNTPRTPRGRSVTVTQPRARTTGEDSSPPSALPRQDEQGSRNTAAPATPRPRKGGKKGKQQRKEVVLSASYVTVVRASLMTTSRTLSGEEFGFASDEDCHSSLTAFFTQGLYNHHHAWREPFREVTSSLLRVLLRSQEMTSDQQWASLALTVLPGVIRFLSITRNPTPIDLLRHAGEEHGEYATQRILRVAVSLKPYVESVREEIAARARSPRPVTKSGLIERLKRRICRLFHDGRIGAAARVVDSVDEMFRQYGFSRAATEGDGIPRNLVDPGAQLTLEQSKEIISELHPPARDEDELPSVEHDDAHIAANKDLAPIHITTDHIREVIQRLPAGSANGASGWTFSTIRFLYREKNQVLEDDINLLTNFCKAFLSGRLCQDHLLLSRAVLIPKNGGAKYRPLGIGECWYRFGCRVIMRVVAHSVGLKLAPLQLGCGVASGCAIGAAQAICALQAAPETAVLIKTDFTNAFNSIPRRAIYEGLAKYCPGLLRWFRWAYGDSRPLLDHHGRELGRSETGCRQGDPLSPLLFCVAMQPALLRLQDRLKELSTVQLDEDDSASTLAAFLLTAYMDDVTIAVPKSISHRVCALLPEIFGSVGLTLNPEKCAVIGSAALSSSSSASYPFPVCAEGADVLGIPVGTLDFQCAQLRRNLIDTGATIRDLRRFELSPAMGFHLLKACFNARPQYLSSFLLGVNARFDHLIGRFDQLLDREIALLCGAPFSAYGSPEATLTGTIRSLPTNLGGLGVYRHSWVQGQKVSLKLHDRIQDFFDKHYPHGFLSIERNLVLGEEDPAGFFPDFDADTEFATRSQSQADSVRTPQEPSLDEKTDLIFELASDSLISRVAESSRLKAAWLRSNRFEGSGRWLMTAADKKQDINKQFSDDEFRVALRWRLLNSPFEDLFANGRDVTCPACLHLVNHSDPFHCLNCPKLGFLSQRHSVLLRVLRDFIKKRVPTSEIRSTLCYHDVVDGRPLEQYADLTVSVPFKGAKMLDLCVANAACPTRVNDTHRPSHTQDLAAARFWEAKKLVDAANTKEAADGTLVPFVLEATGRLGESATRYIHSITGYHAPPPGVLDYIPPPSRILQDEMSTVVTKAQASIAIQYHRMLREANQFPEE